MEKKLQKPIQSIQRAVQILDCFTPTDPSLPLSAISEKTGLNINTTRGLVNTLVESQLLLRDQDTGCYKLGYYFVTKASMIRQDIDRYVELFKPLVDAAAEKYHSLPACRWFIRTRFSASTVPTPPNRPTTSL